MYMYHLCVIFTSLSECLTLHYVKYSLSQDLNLVTYESIAL